MSANPIWIAGYFGPIAGATPVWIAPGDGTVPSAVQSEIVSYYAPVAGATAVWIAGFFAPPPAAIGATPIIISGWGGSGTAPTNSPQALAYLARTVGGNEGGNGANIATLIDGLVSDGVWAKLDALYVLAQQNQSDALLNLVGTSYTLTQVGSLLRPGPRTGSIVFTTYVGFSGFSTNQSYLDTGFTPTTAPSPQYTQNSATLGIWIYAWHTNSGSTDMGQVDDSSFLIPNYNGGGTFYARINDLAGGGVPSPGTVGLFVADRPSSSSVVPYWNGSAQSTITSTAAVTNSHVIIGYSLGHPGTQDTLSAAFIGASLGAAGQLALYNRLRTYMSSVGVP